MTSDFDPSLAAHLREIRHVALDLDGTVYRGRTLFDWTLPFFERLDGLGIGFSFLTNNSSRSVQDYVGHLGEMGIPATLERIVTSALPTLSYLKEKRASIKKIFLLGTKSLAGEFTEHGFEVLHWMGLFRYFLAGRVYLHRQSLLFREFAPAVLLFARPPAPQPGE